MSHIDSIAPSSAQTFTAGQSVDFDITVSGVPADVSGFLRVEGSDGVAAAVNLVLDNPDLAVQVGGAASLLAHQIRASLQDFPGTVTVVSVTGSVAKVRVTAA